jgi:hypothetical protein
MRQAVAALLNSANPAVNYPLSTSQVLFAVNFALLLGQPYIDQLEGTLDTLNDLEGPAC